MPLYKYECQSCKTVTEFLLKISDSDPTNCPECNANSESNMIKIPARTSFILKGTGWYETDFKNSSKKDTNTPSSSNAQDASKQNGSETSGSDNTQETKSASKKANTKDSGSSASSSTASTPNKTNNATNSAD